MTTTTQDQDILALEDIQAHIQDQQAQLDQQLAEARAELESQLVKRATVQKAMTEKRHELGQTQTWLGYKEQDVRRASADLEHSRSTSLEQGKLEALAAAHEARDKAKHESAQQVSALESDSLAERNFTEQIEALAARIEHLSHTAGELQATHERFSHEQCAAILAVAESAVADVNAERERLKAAGAQADTYHDQLLAQYGLQLAAVDERSALDFLIAHIRIDEDPPAVVAALAEAERAKETIATTQRVSFGGSADGPTIAAWRQQVQVSLARVETLRQQARERAAVALLRELRQPAPAVEVPESVPESPPAFVVEVEAVRVPAREIHELRSGIHAVGVLKQTS